MKTNRLVMCGCVLAGLAFLPAASAAAAVRDGVVQQETNSIFKDIQLEAGQARYHAERLKSIVERADAVSWVSDVNQLDQIRLAVNDMSRQVSRLETIRQAAQPRQQKTIDRIATDVTLLADNTQDALAFGEAHRETLWVPTYQKYVDNLYTEARKLAQSVRSAVQHSDANSSD
jgi:hypothetical protein